MTHKRLALATALLALALAIAPAASASAAEPAPHWLATIQPAPAYFAPGAEHDFYEAFAIDDGGAATAGEIVATDTLPAGVTVVGEAEGYAEVQGFFTEENVPMACSTESSGTAQRVRCTTEASVPIGRLIAIKVDVAVPAGASGALADSLVISGGGAATTSATSTTPVTNAPVPYGASFTGELSTAEGTTAQQAGSHPFAFTTLIGFNVGATIAEEACQFGNGSTAPPCAAPDHAARDIEVALPPGLVGDPQAVPRCTQAQFQSPGYNNCPADTQVGALTLRFYGGGDSKQRAPVYNVEPPPGQPAELGFTVSSPAHIPIFFHVRSEGDYGLTANLSEISEFEKVKFAALSIWGVPADTVHDPLRESLIPEAGVECEPPDGCKSGAPPRPFLTLPTSCEAAPLALPFASDSWQEPSSGALPTVASAKLANIEGCEALSFDPSLSLSTTTSEAGAPAGYDVGLHVPQHEGPEELATPAVADAEVTLPQGTVVSPSAANGLLACSEAQFGIKVRAKGQCPEASKLGTVSVLTPLLEAPLEGSLFLGEPECSPCTAAQAEAGEMVHLLLEAQGSGVIVKLAGHTRIDAQTGQLTTSFDQDPQLPFSELSVDLEGGPDAPLANPSACGPATASAALTPWSSASADPISVNQPLQIGDCAPAAFTPSIEAGMSTSARGGESGSFDVTISRPDRQQPLGHVSVQLPPGITGMLSKVALCGEPEANDGACPASSQIGTVSSYIGPGSEPYDVTGGKVFVTGPYDGAPFGLSIVVPAQAGPLRLAGVYGNGASGDGDVVVRGSIGIDPRTAAITVSTGQLPTQLDGIPLDIRKVLVEVDRPGFIVNPTDCQARSIDATIASASGTAVSASYPFQASDCASLPFKPSFTATTHAGHDRKDGAYLQVGIASSAGQANIARVHVQLPEKLPSRLATLKLACTEAQFAANPAGCPAGSMVGTAVAHTPTLPAPLSGPAIFVSHGGAAFPNLDIVLQGSGVTVILEGDTFISKHGVTTSTFASVPDVPVTSFELTLPARANSALAAFGSLCRKPLLMPTKITGQNGAFVEQQTRIKVLGCKPAVEVVAHSVRAAIATVHVRVSGAGTLSASGHGLSSVRERIGKAGVTTLRLRLDRATRKLAARYPSRRLKERIALRFTPKGGRPISTHVTVLIR